MHDPEVAETLSPRSFPYGTRRPCLDTGYYATFNRPNVHLVDLLKTPLIEFTEAEPHTSAAEYEFDAIVFAAGFDAMTGALAAIDIRNGNGGIPVLPVDRRAAELPGTRDGRLPQPVHHHRTG